MPLAKRRLASWTVSNGAPACKPVTAGRLRRGDPGTGGTVPATPGVPRHWAPRNDGVPPAPAPAYFVPTPTPLLTKRSV